jgi:hypothetical protein
MFLQKPNKASCARRETAKCEDYIYIDRQGLEIIDALVVMIPYLALSRGTALTTCAIM